MEGCDRRNSGAEIIDLELSDIIGPEEKEMEDY